MIAPGAWAGFMAGELTGGEGYFRNARGIVTFSARQVDPQHNHPACRNATYCYVKYVVVQGFI